jgi:hypothetical protein
MLSIGADLDIGSVTEWFREVNFRVVRLRAHSQCGKPIVPELVPKESRLAATNDGA